LSYKQPIFEIGRMAAFNVENLLRPDIYGMEEYTPIEPFEVLSTRLGLPAERIIKLDGNENPYGPSPRALAALGDYRGYHVYPDPEHTLLREAIQDYVGVDKAHIMFGAGSDELIDLIMRLFLQPGDAIINCPPHLWHVLLRRCPLWGIGG